MKNIVFLKHFYLKYWCLIFIFTVKLYASSFYSALDPGVRAAGMGNAFTAIADDGSAMFYNPAGVAAITWNELATMYQRILYGLDDGSMLSNSFVSYTQPWNKFGTSSFVWYNFTLPGAYEENTFNLSYAKKINSWYAIGINLKLLSLNYGIDEYTVTEPVLNFGQTRSATAVAVDIGILGNVTSSFNWGLSFINLNQPSLGIAAKKPVPVKIRTGVSVTELRYNLGLDLLWQQDRVRLMCGVESLLTRTLRLRAGLGIGTNNWRTLSIGIGYIHQVWSFDYTFSYPLTGIEDTVGNHSISFNFYFGKLLPLDQKVKLHFDLGKQYLQDNELELAITEWQKVLNIDPWHTEANEGIKTARKKIRDQQLRLEESLHRAEQAALEAIKAADQTQKNTEKVEKNVEKIETHLNSLPKPKKEKFYVILPGDTLESIAAKIYGDSNLWTDIYELNKERIKAGILVPGEVLILP